MKKLKVVQIGIQHDHAANAMNSMRKQTDIFDVLGYVVPENETTSVSTAYEGLKEFTLEEAFNIPDLDAVVVETREENLTKYALMAAKRGLAVHMDKPGGLNINDFKELINTVKSNNNILHFGYMYRYNPAVIKLLKDIKDGKLGNVYCVEAHMDCMHLPEKRNWLNNFKGGQMFYLGCHLVDLIYTIMGEPQEIIPLNCSTDSYGITASDYGMAVFKYKNGISFAKSCACEPGGYMRRQLVVCGDKGTIQICPFEINIGDDYLYTDVREVYDEIYEWGNDGVRYRTEKYNRYDNMMYAFWEFSTGKRENPYTLEYELRLYELLLKSCGEEL